jgi:hypothetical protein
MRATQCNFIGSFLKHVKSSPKDNKLQDNKRMSPPRSRKDIKLGVISGETGKGSFPGGGQGGTYIGWLKQLAASIAPFGS